MKRTDRIPGNQVPYEDGNTIAQMILSAINPNQLPPLALWETLTVLTKDDVIQQIQNSVTKQFYLLYVYYFNKKIGRLEHGLGK